MMNLFPRNTKYSVCGSVTSRSSTVIEVKMSLYTVSDCYYKLYFENVCNILYVCINLFILTVSSSVKTTIQTNIKKQHFCYLK